MQIVLKICAFSGAEKKLPPQHRIGPPETNPCVTRSLDYGYLLPVNHMINMTSFSTSFTSGLAALGVAGVALTCVQAGEPAPLSMGEPVASQPILEDPFERAIRPITNPTLFDLAVPRTQLHPIYMYQSFPSSIDTAIGKVPVDGEFNLVALQFEYALSEQFSLVALKDGYIDLNPDNTLSEESGFANLAAGFKWAFLYKPEDRLAMSLMTQVEIPTGNSDVFQGTGDGALIPSLSLLKLYDRFQFAETLGLHLPFDSDEESTTLFYSAHLSYALTERFFPLVEVNYFRVLDEGDGGSRFGSQVGGAVPAVAEFEGGDLINLGAANADKNRDLVTLGLGFRFRANEHIDLGAAYEIPLTGKSDNLMSSRITVDMVYRF